MTLPGAGASERSVILPDNEASEVNSVEERGCTDADSMGSMLSARSFGASSSLKFTVPLTAITESLPKYCAAFSYTLGNTITSDTP